MLSALAWLPRGAAKPIPRAAASTEEELAEAARLAAAAAAGRRGRHGRGGGSASDDDDDGSASSSSGWETDESGSQDMEADGDAPPTPAPAAELAVAKRAAARVKAAGASFLTSLVGVPTSSLASRPPRPVHSLSLLSPNPSGKSAATNDPALDAAMAALDMDNYDREDETDDEEEGGEGEGSKPGGARGSRRVLDGLFGGEDALYYASNAEDPYMALARGAAARGVEGGPCADPAPPDADVDPPATDSEDEEAWDLRPTDFVLAAARTEDDVSTLEVWVYEAGAASEGGANLYVHHDLLLGAFPLALAWLDCAPGGGGGAGAGTDRANFVAVGTMDPVIELWDLDAADAVAPVATLGAASAPGKKDGSKKKKGSKAAAKAAAAAGGPHAGAVLGLAWNKAVRNVLASASADGTVKVWDIAAAGGGASASSSPVTTLTHHHTNKVQALAWHPADPAVLLSGGFDGRACLADVRAPAGEKTPAWAVGSDVEALAWDPTRPAEFCVATEDGHVRAYDARAGGGGAPRFTLAAHSRPTTILAFAGPAAPGLLATGSTDKKVKLWDVAGDAPALVEAQDLKVGAVFAAGFSEDAALPGVLAVAGAKGTVSVWEVGAAESVAARWPGLAGV